MSENTINAALRHMSFDKDTMTDHGFRAMASTRLSVMRWPPDVIKRQLPTPSATRCVLATAARSTWTNAPA